MTTSGTQTPGPLSRWGARLALVAPPAAGPQRWQRFVTESRLEAAAARLRDEPATAALLAASVADHAERPGEAWRIAAAARELAGDDAGALDAVRRAIDAGEQTVATALMWRRSAARLGRTAQAHDALVMLARTPPRNHVELERAITGIVLAGRDLVDEFDAMVSALPFAERADRSRLDDLLDEFALGDAAVAGPEAFAAARARVLREREAPLLWMTQALVRARAWRRLAEFIVTTPPDSPEIGPRGAGAPFPTAEVGRAAVQALRAGDAHAASMLAARALVARPGRDDFRRTFAAARDQLSISRSGWTFPPRAVATPYEPDTRAVLSVLSQSAPIRSGGYAARSHGVATALTARGWDVQAVTRLGFPYDGWDPGDTREVPASDTVDGIVYHRLLDPGVRGYPQVPLADYVDRFERGVRDLAARHRVALIHGSSFYVVGLAGLTAARRLGLPFIYEMRGLEELMTLSRDPAFAGSDRHRFLERVETAVARESDLVFVITEALGREMVGRGVAEDRIVVVPNGVHTDRFTPRGRDRELESRLRLAGKTVIGYAGGLVDYEGLELLLDAVAGLGLRDDLQVLIVGDGAAEPSLRDRAERLGLGASVSFTGRVPHDQVRRYLSLVDVAPFPRLPLPVCELISPIKPFESMAMEKAVVVSDVAALTEFVDDGVTGRVFRKGDAGDLRRVLADLLDDAGQRRELGVAARDWVLRNRDWSTLTDVVDAAYTAALTGATGSRG
ncbi:glycosyltransferase family 4 protein [Jiangella alkaliphila]|uniref:Glycosyltransferase involved in cell wall bisynthesis n=1 Tax=Jiangella alkaliphila TaxID=419479 RepID=A0A1H2LZT6_9ACTN|nr:glycosyltransferase family 4 protein [Jiangella alkaliphila]SDU86228.1 Glycosyltransferase involved in cell wall bisynthesis [Jiangella alkaliphila]